MHLNRALVSSFLFVSAVLAASHPEKQQPPFLDRVEKSINRTIDLGINALWGGVVQLAQRQADYIDYAAGTFPVPSIIHGIPGQKYDVAVILSGLIPCPYSTLGAGINVEVTADGRVSYKAWGQWGRGDIKSDQSFRVSTQDMVTAIVRMLSSTTGLFILINHTGEPQVFAAYISGVIMNCGQDAAWVISSAPLAQLESFPNFGEVTFTNDIVGISGDREVPNNPQIIDILLENGSPVTAVTDLGPGYVAISYALLG